MKRVSIIFIWGYTLITVILCTMGTEMGVQWGVPTEIRFATLPVWIGLTYWLYCIYPNSFQERLSRLADKKNICGIGFRSDFFLPESYFIDCRNGYLIGIMAFNPFGFQYMDLKDVENIEMVTKIFNKSVVASIRCRLQMKNKKFDIWLYRDARYQAALEMESEKEKAILTSAEEIQTQLKKAVEVAKRLRIS